MGKRIDLGDFDKGQIVMARRLGLQKDHWDALDRQI